MTITPDQAQALLDGATPGPWHHDEAPGPGEDPTRATEVYPQDESGVIAYVQPFAADVALISAAPDLARTVIDQAEEIEKMRSTVAAFINKRPEYITALLASPGSDADYWRWSGHAEARRQIAQELGWTVPHNRSETTSQEADQ